MSVLHQDYSTLTDRYQTTVPASVRKVLNLQKRDQLCYQLEADGRVYLDVKRAPTDPALGAFLELLEADIKANPQRLAAFDGALGARLGGLVGGVDVDLDAPLSPEDE